MRPARPPGPPAATGGGRLGWSELPVHLRDWVEGLLGDGPVVAAKSQEGGFSPGTADRLLTAGGRRAFVKAVSPGQNEDTPDLHRREAEVVALLPRSPRTPELYGSYDDGHWVALVFEDVPGRTPELPWTGAGIDVAMASLVQLAAALTPSPVPQGPALAHDYAEMFGGWHRIRDEPPDQLDPWAVEHLDELVELAAVGVTALAGNTLVHADIRADNLLVGPDGRVTVVDWPWACTGAAWFDRLLLIVNVDLYGGHDPDALVAEHLAALVDPRTVSAVIAGLSGFFADLARRPAIRGLPTVRAFQAAQAASTLAWLRRRLG